MGVLASAGAVALVTAGDRAARAVRPGAEPRRRLRLRGAAGRGRLGARLRRFRSRSRACSRSTGSSCRRRTRSRCADGENWFALAVYVVVAVVVSELASRASPACDATRSSASGRRLCSPGSRPSLLQRRRDRRTSSSGSRPERRQVLRRRRTRRIVLGADAATPGEIALRRCGVGGREIGTLSSCRAGRRVGRGRGDALPAVRSRRSSRWPSIATAPARGARSRDSAAQRRDQDGPAARRLPRPALAADGDLARRRAVSTTRDLRSTSATGRICSRRSARESTRLDRLVGNLLDLSRLEAGAAATAAELWTVDELVGRALGAGRGNGARGGGRLPEAAAGAGRRARRSSACSRT